MFASHSSTSLAGFVAEAPGMLDVSARQRAPSTLVLQDTTEHAETVENRLRRRDHRVALALMVGSSLLSTAALYGAWTLLRAAI